MLQDVLDQPILYGATPDKNKDVQGYRLLQTLARVLREQNCTFLIGGHLAFDKNYFTVSPYILHQDGTLVRPVEPIGQKTVSSATATAEEIGQRLVRYLAKQREALGFVEVGCFRMVGDAASKESLADLAQGIRRATKVALSDDPRLLGRVRETGAPLCTGAEATRASPDTVAVVTAEITGEQEQLVVKPYVRFSTTAGGSSDSVPVLLAPSTNSRNRTVQVVRSFVDQISTFFGVVTAEDGAFLPLADLGVPVTRNDLIQASDWLSAESRDENAGKFGRVLVLAYKGLSQNADDKLAYLVLGQAFLQKGKSLLAIDHLKKVLAPDREPAGNSNMRIQRSADLPAEFSGRLYQSLGKAYEEAEDYGAALKYYQTAEAWYVDARDVATGFTMTQRVASVRLKQGDMKGARAELADRLETRNDYEALYLLGNIDFVADDLTSSITWFEKAAALKSSDKRANKALAEIYELRGQRSRLTRNYAEAEAFFKTSLEKLPSLKVSYLAGLTAMDRANFKAAATYFDSVLKAAADTKPAAKNNSNATWVEASWANLLESLLLSEDYGAVELRAEEADSALASPALLDSRLLALYIRFVARVFQAPSETLENLDKDPILIRLKALKDQEASLQNLKWTNTLLKAFLEGKAREQPQRVALLNLKIPELFLSK